jgi:hypothetical protein
MSKIFECGRFLIHVWPKDHLPVHCHVYVDDQEFRVFLPDFKVQMVGNSRVPTSTIKEALAIVKDHQNAIGKEWRRLHGN